MILETDENENYHSDTADEMTDANYVSDTNHTVFLLIDTQSYFVSMASSQYLG